MAFYFSYDRCEHRHNIYVFNVYNEKNDIVAYRPVVSRYPKSGGVVEDISEKYPGLKWKVFSTEKLARDFAIDFFTNLKLEQ